MSETTNNGDFKLRREALPVKGSRKVMAMDTISSITPDDAGCIVISGSHGGLSSAEYAAREPLAMVFFNDAGVGKDNAGIAGLEYLQQRGIAAGVYAHDSAMIGNAFDAWENGVISGLNDLARKAGYMDGTPLHDSIRSVIGG